MGMKLEQPIAAEVFLLEALRVFVGSPSVLVGKGGRWRSEILYQRKKK
jgi:hypothetical protein